MNELYIHMAVWDEPELEFPIETSCGMNELRRRWKMGKERKQKIGNKRMENGKGKKD